MTRALRLEVVAAGIRYRFAAGLRQAMRVWTALVVAIVAVSDLQGSLPRLSGRQLLAVTAALTFGTLPLLRRILRSEREQHVQLLPVTAGERFVTDLAAVFLFSVPAHLLIVVAARSVEVAGLLVAGCCVSTLLLGWSGGLQPAERQGRRRAEARRSTSYELRWLLRMGGGRIVSANVLALLCAGGAELAIRNNEVTALHATARIAGAFYAIGAAFVAAELVASRNAAEPWRSLEWSLPLSASARLRAFLLAAASAAIPFLGAMALLRPVALPFAAALLLGLLLCRETRVIWAIAVAGTVLSALDARIASVVAVAMLPWLWRRAA